MIFRVEIFFICEDFIVFVYICIIGINSVFFIVCIKGIKGLFILMLVNMFNKMMVVESNDLLV